MRRTNLLLAGALVLFMGMMGTANAEPIQALLITGDDVAPYHDWRDISEATRDVLEETEKFEVKVCEDAFILESKTALDRYDLVILTSYNAKTPTLSDQARENLLNFVKGGKGFVVTHLASASYKEWDEFKKLCGRVWVMGKSGHSPRSMFEAKIANKNHPITQGIENFRIFDELYSGLEGDAEIEVLVEADSDYTKKTEPLLFVQNYGKGRVVHDAFGHDYKAIKNKTHKLLLVHACEWAATGKVTD